MEKTKNTFQDGLIMDFSPDNTSATSLTSALNATILTFNGNEMALQNDMGNGRVETAYLPEGYIPVGTCEFGDIIYIASYNPLTNRSLIGCFPSPERNISSEELGGFNQSLNYTDFLITDNSGTLTGELKSTAVRKVLIDNRNTNPGDKYVIFSELASENFEKFGELENSKKYLKLSVVSIDDSGKITYLDTDTHYYQYNEHNVVYDHFIAPKLIRSGTDVDEYRNMLLSGWNIFSSKNPGKLAILAELNTIDTFSCTYSVIVDEVESKNGEKAIKYTVYFTPTFDSSEELKVYLSRENIGGVNEVKEGDKTYYEFLVIKTLFEKSKVDAEGKPIPLYNIKLNEVSDTSKIPNYHNTKFDNFSGPIPGEGEETPEPIISGHSYLAFEVTIPYYEKEGLIKSELLVYSCDIIPAMPFGKLDYLKVPITIDFNKIGSGEIGLTRWRYYNLGTLCTLQYGLEIYNKPNEETESVTIDFYDNTGHAARYLLEDVDSFSGIHTEYLGLNGENYNYRLSKLKGSECILHKGSEYREFNPDTDEAKDFNGENGLYRITKLDNEEVDYLYVLEVKDGEKKIYTNDAGTLYANALYAAVITVTTHNVTNTELKDTKVYWKWLWTNAMYNLYYYQVDDFSILKFTLDLDVNAIFEASSLYKWEEKKLNNLDNGIEDGFYNSYSANVLYIGLDDLDNINLYLQAGLLDNYGCFNLPLSILEDDAILSEIYLGKSIINYSDYEDNFEFSSDHSTLTEEQYLRLSKIVNKNELDGTENNKYITRRDPINVKGIVLNDVFNITFNTLGLENNILLNNTIEDDEYGLMTAPKLSCSLKDCYYADTNNKKAVKLKLAASIFTKSYTYNSLKYAGEVPTYSPIIDSQSDLQRVGIISDDSGNLLFKSGMIGQVRSSHEYTGISALSSTNGFQSATGDDDKYKINSPNATYNSYGNTKYVTDIYNNFLEDLSLFFVFYPGGYSPDGKDSYEWVSVYGNSGAEDINTTFLSRIGHNNNRYEKLKQLAWEWSGDVCALDVTSSGDILHVRPSNAVGILCIKHPSGGFMALNNCSYDYDPSWESSKGNYLSLKARIYDGMDVTQYLNLATPLYLILSRIYSKNKTVPSSNQLKQYSYVRRSPYSTTLTKDVIVKLLSNSNTNILMSGLDYNAYKNDLFKILDDTFEGVAKYETKSLELSFNSCVKNTTLTMEVNNIPIEFPEIEDKAFFTYNGGLIACDKIDDDQFYIYYDGKLMPYYDLKFKFLKNDIISNLKYVLGKEVSDINITTSKVIVPATEMELAADDLSSAIYNFAVSSNFYTLANNFLSNLRSTYLMRDLQERLAWYLIDYFICTDDYYYLNLVSYKTVKDEYNKWAAKYPNYVGNKVLGIAYNVCDSASISLWENIMDSLLINKYEERWLYDSMRSLNFVHADTKLNDMITITPLLSLSENFQYSGNKFQLRENSPHNMLRLCMGRYDEKPSGKTLGVNCIMKDVSIDITHRITKDEVG